MGVIKNIAAGNGSFLAYCSLMSISSTVRVTRARISIRVFLRMTAMDVCCGPPASR
jgi:hypothetical protein